MKILDEEDVETFNSGPGGIDQMYDQFKDMTNYYMEIMVNYHNLLVEKGLIDSQEINVDLT